MNNTFISLKVRPGQHWGVQFKENEDVANFIAVIQYVVEQLGGDPGWS
jgi:hypothetical protein